MGSWNGTCGVTQLPITAGQRVALIPLIIKQHDFLSRDSLAGGGACSHDVIAQPFSMPLFGKYDDYGGIELDDNQVGTECLLQVFKKLIKSKRLMRIPRAKPEEVEKLDIELLDEMMRRELIYQVKNPRKAWLQQLHDTYASLAPEEQGGMAHYKPQMEVDLNTLPDLLDLGMGAMMVHEDLYLSLAATAGAEKAYGHWDDESNSMVNFEGTRREELESFASVAPEVKEKLQASGKEVENMLVGQGFSEDQIQHMREILSLASLKQAYEISQNVMFFPYGINMALSQAGEGDNAKARELWVNFVLFNAAMISLRKQWTPQTGAGSSAGLSESHEFYKAEHAFVGKMLDEFYARRSAYEAEAAAREAARQAAKPKKPRAPKKKSEAQS